MTFSASVLILAVIIIRALFLHRVPKMTFSVLWAVVLCRLLVPFSIPSPISIYTLTDRAGSMVTNPAGTSTISTGKVIIPSLAPAFEAHAGVANLSPTVSPLVLVWLAGMITCAMYLIFTHLRCLREYKTALPVENEFIKKWHWENSTRRHIRIKQLDTISAPLTYGTVKPVILLPKTTDYSDKEKLGYILVHEHTHIRRFDTLVKCVLAVALSVHWFNPLVWIMYVLANRDLELACDEAVVRKFGENKRSAYARALIAMEERKSRLTPLCNNFSKNAIEKRIVSIMKMREKTKYGVVLAVLLIVGTTTVFATSATAAVIESDGTGIQISSDVVLSRLNEETGEYEISTDNGKTWANEEDEDYFPNVEWWTYDGYKVWMEQEIQNLTSFADDGEPDYYDKDGNLKEFTQEDVDEAAALYKSILEDIKNGARVSKSVDGCDDVIISMSPPNNNVAVATAYGAVFTGDNGEQIEFGPYETEEELLSVLEPYCEDLIKSGEMTQEEVDELMNKYK